MNEDVFNTSLRRFLKKVGITSQREIEKAVRDAVAGRPSQGPREAAGQDGADRRRRQPLARGDRRDRTGLGAHRIADDCAAGEQQCAIGKRTASSRCSARRRNHVVVGACRHHRQPRCRSCDSATLDTAREGLITERASRRHHRPRRQARRSHRASSDAAPIPTSAAARDRAADSVAHGLSKGLLRTLKRLPSDRSLEAAAR